GLGTDDIGVYFFLNGPTTVSTTTVLPVVPQIDYTSFGPITIQNGWLRVTATFTADSAYDHIVIGAFKNPANVTTAPAPGGTGAFAYYYIDSVVIKTANT